MNGPDLMAYLSMGGYGLYVWGSFGVTFAVLALELWSLRRRWRAARQMAPRPAR